MSSRGRSRGGGGGRRMGGGMKRPFPMMRGAMTPGMMPRHMGFNPRMRGGAFGGGGRPEKFGFFNHALPSLIAGHVGEKRIATPKKPVVSSEVNKEAPPTPVPAPVSVEKGVAVQHAPGMNGSQKTVKKHLLTPEEAAKEEELNGAINELFAKMVWKKLDLIKNPLRLSRLHTEIMNVLQQAVAEEGAPVSLS